MCMNYIDGLYELLLLMLLKTLQVCGKAFNSRDNRNAHRFVHSDKKPYECLVCGAGFMRKPLLYNHMQTQVRAVILTVMHTYFMCTSLK